MALTISSLVITAVICYGIFEITKWHWRRRRLYKMASKFEGPRTLPIVGNAHLLFGNSEYRLKKFQEINASYSSPFRFWIGPRLFICADEPEQIKRICLSPHALGKGELTEFSRDLLGEGLLTSPVAKWKVHRKLIQSTFNLKILDSFVEIFVDQSKIFTEQIAKNLDGPEFELGDVVNSCTLDMICETAMGVKMRAQTDPNCLFVEAFHKAVPAMTERFFHIWLQPDIIFYNTRRGRDVRKHLKYLHDFTDNVIQMKRMKFQRRETEITTADDENNAVDSTLRREAFLDHLMKLTHDNVHLSDQALREEVNTMVIVGSEESAMTLTNTLLMLASYPEVQEKVYQELYEIYGNDDIEEHPVSPKDLPRMKYMERVMRETMRLFPVAPLLLRNTTEDLDLGAHIVPRGSSVVLEVFSMHRDEKYWPDPLKFDPDRFLPEEVAKRHPYAYFAFSGGPRNCVGYNYALMSMKTFVATVLRKYVLKKENVLPIEDIRLKMEILLRMVDPVTIRIEKRIRS